MSVVKISLTGEVADLFSGSEIVMEGDKKPGPNTDKLLQDKETGKWQKKENYFIWIQGGGIGGNGTIFSQ